MRPAISRHRNGDKSRFAPAQSPSGDWARALWQDRNGRASRDLTSISHHAHGRLKTSSAQPSMLRREDLNGHAHAGSRLPFREDLPDYQPPDRIHRDLTDRLSQFIAEADVCASAS